MSVENITIRHRKPVARDVVMARAAKAASTKLAKRITKSCKACGKEWKEKPSHSWRKYCSALCAGNKIKNPNHQKSCAQCGANFDTTWNSRKKITCSKACAHKRHANIMKERGINPLRYRDEAKWLAAVQSEHNRKVVGAFHRGKVRTTPKSKRHSPNHSNAVTCFLRAPNNVIHYVQNITAFVHNNPGLFLPQTLNWKRSGRYTSAISCAASKGLAMVARGARMTWRGWQVISDREGRERFDLIGRNWLPLNDNVTQQPK